MNDDSRPMNDVRGTVILADYVAPMTNGKWAIAGTFNQVMAAPGAVMVTLPPLHLYIRFQVEHAKEYACDLLLVYRSLASSEPPIFRQTVTLAITDPRQPCEFACTLPSFQVECPQVDDRKADESIGVSLLFWLKVGGCDIATSPLNVIFPPPQGVDHATHPRPEPGTDP